jgi:hypothetical protein
MSLEISFAFGPNAPDSLRVKVVMHCHIWASIIGGKWGALRPIFVAGRLRKPFICN